MDECKDLKPWICGGTLSVVYPDVCGDAPSDKVCEAVVCESRLGCA